MNARSADRSTRVGQGVGTVFTPLLIWGLAAALGALIFGALGGPAWGATADPEIDLVIVKTTEQGAVTPGDLVTFAIEASNAGPSGALAVFVVDTLPPGLQFESVNRAACAHDGSAAGGEVICDLGSFLPGDAVTIRLVTRVAPGAAGVITNRAEVQNREDDASAPEEIDTSNNTDEASVTVEVAPASLAATLSDGGATPRTGESFRYDFTVVNVGGTAAVVDSVEFRIPRQLQAVRCITGGASAPVTGSAGVVTCPGGRVEGPGTLTTELEVKVVRGLRTTIMARASAGSTERCQADRLCDFEPTELNGGPGRGSIVLRLSATPAERKVTVGETAGFTLQLHNSSDFAATGIVVAIDVHGGLAAVSGPGETWRPRDLNPGATTSVDLALRGVTPGGFALVAAVTTVNQPDWRANDASADVAVSAVLGAELVAPAGRVFEDADADGAADPGEQGISGVTVQLIGPSGRPSASDVTGSDGRYRLGPAQAGSIVRVVPAGRVATSPQVRLAQPNIDFGLLGSQTIPATGMDAGAGLAAGFGMLVLGGLLTAVARRRGIIGGG